MRPRIQAGFELDTQLEADTCPVLWLTLCEVRLMNDRRWPWLILIPQRANIEELHDLTPLDQAMLTFETNLVAAALKQATACHKINSGALGNVVHQLHFHIVARNEGDTNWPGPVWGFGEREPYRKEDRHQLIAKLKDAISSQTI
ncbi:MAG: HIT family protein [Notoacmeibacter sp.]|nr:HIT family protein [Notoacmeibacter sp.]